MLKLTRLNNHVVAINPDHVVWADATPDTTLFLAGGERIIVRESLDELVARVVEFRRLVRDHSMTVFESRSGELPPESTLPTRLSDSPARPSVRPSRSPMSRRGVR